MKADPKAAEAAPGGGNKKKLLIIILGAVLLLGGVGGGAAWFFLHGKSDDGAPVKKHKEAAKAGPPVFQVVEPFTVNLLPEAGDHYLQVGLVYQVADDKVVEDMKTYMPVIRNRILLLLSGKHPSDLAQVDGKQKLVTELVGVARESLPGEGSPDRGVNGAFLSSFVIQ